MRGVARDLRASVGFVLGRGEVNNPIGVRRDGSYSLVGVADDRGEWQSIQPYFEEVGWLQELDCVLVAIPAAEFSATSFEGERVGEREVDAE